MASKSVLSQSANVQSASGLALGSLMAKQGSKKKKPDDSAPRDDQSKSVIGGGAPTSPTPVSPETRSPDPRKADATKSVMSAATGLTSGSAMALQGALAKQGSSKREGSAQRNGDGNSATKSVLSQSTGVKSGSAMALGALLNKQGGSPQRGSSPPSEPAAAAPAPNSPPNQGYPEAAQPSQAAAPAAAPWMSANQPTKAEAQKQNNVQDPHGPLLHPDDAWQGQYKDNLPRDIRVEHDGGRTKSSGWAACCTSSSATQVDMISKPKLSAAVHSRHLSVTESRTPQKPARSDMHQHMEHAFLGISLHCTSCTKEIIQEISDSG